METKYRTAALALLLSLAAGCSFHARSPDDYRKAVHAALEPRNAQLKSCYEKELAADPAAAGQVVVKFEVEAKTGNFMAPVVDDAATTSNEQVQQCVVSMLDGVKLDPPDHRKGQGTLTWAFSH